MWAGNPDLKISNEKREKLLAKRLKLTAELEHLKTSSLPKGDPIVQTRFRQEDMMALATKILQVDKQLGRTK